MWSVAKFCRRFDIYDMVFVCMSAGHVKTIEEVRRDFRENEDSFLQIRGFSTCRFCKKRVAGVYAQQGQPGYVCDNCITGVAEAQALAIPGEIIHIPYLQEADKKKVKVTVQVRRNRDDVDFEHVSESNTWTMGNPYNPVQRRSYFLKKSVNVTVGVQNLEGQALILQVTHVDENFKHAEMEEVSLKPNGVYEHGLVRSDGEDRESLKICDRAGNLSLMLSFQEELPVISKKRSRRDGSAADPIEFDSDVGASLRSLYSLGQAL